VSIKYEQCVSVVIYLTTILKLIRVFLLFLFAVCCILEQAEKVWSDFGNDFRLCSLTLYLTRVLLEMKKKYISSSFYVVYLSKVQVYF